MKCPNCGREIAKGSKFCGFCGYELSDEEMQQSGGKNVLNNIMNILKNTDKKILGIGALVVCLVIGLVVFFTTRKPTIDLQDYVTVEISGADGYGRAEVDFDYDQFEEDVLDAAGLTDIANQVIGDADLEDVLSSEDYSKIYNCAYAIESVDYEIDVASGLSNGDKVTVTFTFNNDLASEAGFKFKGDDLTVTVSDLEETTAVDPFEGVTIEYTGTSPFLEASVVNESTNSIVAEHVNFSLRYTSLSGTGYIAIGDTITLTVENDLDDLASEYGITLSSTSKEYICEIADYYVTDPSDIGDNALEDMKSTVETELDDYFDNDKRSCSNVNYEGYYFLTLEDQTLNTGLAHNIVVMVYSANVTNSQISNTKLYFRIQFSNVITNSGTGESTVSLSTSALPFHGGNDLYFDNGIYGYESVSDILSEFESNYEENYTIESVDLN